MEEYKGYHIKPVKDLIGFQIEYIGRGSTHMSLRGTFSDKRIAKKFIDLYVGRKEEEDGQRNSGNRSQQVQRRTKHRLKPANNH